MVVILLDQKIQQDIATLLVAFNIYLILGRIYPSPSTRFVNTLMPQLQPIGQLSNGSFGISNTRLALDSRSDYLPHLFSMHSVMQIGQVVLMIANLRGGLLSFFAAI
jgi:hypothetical protein